MNDPPTRMGAPGLRGATRLAHAPLRAGRAGSFPREVVRGAPLAPGAPNPAAAAAGASGSGGGAREDRGAEDNLDSPSRVREKVLFLLHPERGSGTLGGPAREEAAAGGEDEPAAGGEERARSAPSSPRGERGPRGPGAPPRPLLVRVLDYRATEEVQLTEWTRGCMATRTEERAMTVVTYAGRRDPSARRGAPGAALRRDSRSTAARP